MLFVFVRFVFTSRCLLEGSCLIYIICVCLVRLYLQLFVGGLMSYFCYLCLFGSSLPSVVCWRAHVLFMLFVFVWFVFTFSCLLEGSGLIYVICVCLPIVVSNSHIVLCFCFVFLRLVYPMLSLFSNVYLSVSYPIIHYQ
jgi:hypothetical protein